MTAGACVPSAVAAAERLIAQAAGTGMDTSAGLLFNHSVWARDRVLTAADLLAWRPAVARATILTLASLQGVRASGRSEEEPGRIHNEFRDIAAWRAPPYLKALFAAVIAPAWGGGPRGYVTYFSADTTPMYVSLVRAYAELDPSILSATVVDRAGGTVSIFDTVTRAVDWLLRHVTADELVVVPKHNPVSLPPQTWRDSPTSNLTREGRMPNVFGPVAWLDVQVLAVDALRDAAALLRSAASRPSGGPSPDDLLERAGAVRDATLESFWMPDAEYFGVALDQDASGAARQIDAIQSNAGWMLAGSFFDGLPEAARARYVGGIVRWLFSPQMLTAAGVRGRALDDANPAFRNYHEHVWPVDTATIARGLRRQGFAELAEQLEARLLNALDALGGHDEFIAVDDAGLVVDPRPAAGAHGEHTDGGDRRPALPTEMVPEREIGFTVSAVLRIKRERAEWAAARRAAVRSAPVTGRQTAPGPTARPAWADRLTAEVLAAIDDVRPHRTVREALDDPLPFSPLRLDHATGLERAILMVVRQALGGVVPAYVRARLREARLHGSRA